MGRMKLQMLFLRMNSDVLSFNFSYMLRVRTRKLKYTWIRNKILLFSVNVRCSHLRQCDTFLSQIRTLGKLQYALRPNNFIGSLGIDLKFYTRSLYYIFTVFFFALKLWNQIFLSFFFSSMELWNSNSNRVGNQILRS